MNFKNRFFALCCIVLIFTFFSCEKQETHGQGGYDTLSAPVSYDDIILAEETSVYDEPTLEYIVYRVKKDDMLTVIDTYFMPYGIESDQYSIIGKIINFKEVENDLTKEIIYCMEVECNNIFFSICINKKDLIGEPAIGRRFKGNIWMQGTINL